MKPINRNAVKYGYSVEDIYEHITTLVGALKKGGLTQKELGAHIANINKEFGTNFKGPFIDDNTKEWRVSYNTKSAEKLNLKTKPISAPRQLDLFEDLKESGDEVQKTCKL